MKITTGSKIKIGTKVRKSQLTDAMRHSAAGKGSPVLCSPLAEDSLNKHMESGVLAGYEPRNWEKGLPLSSILDSLLRHIRQEREGLKDEDHANAILWNTHIYVHTKEAIRRGLLPAELNDLPSYIPKICPKHPKEKFKHKPKNKCDICKMIWENKED